MTPLAAGAPLAHVAWALWLAVPVVGIVLVSLAVWLWSRPARPATTPASIAGHEAYLEALVRRPRERTGAPVPDLTPVGEEAGAVAPAPESVDGTQQDEPVDELDQVGESVDPTDHDEPVHEPVDGTEQDEPVEEPDDLAPAPVDETDDLAPAPDPDTAAPACETGVTGEAVVTVRS